MEYLKIDKRSVMKAYRNSNEDQKAMLECLYGKEAFAYEWREITSYKKACEVLGIQAREFKEIGDRPQYMRMANAMEQLLVICEAINGNGGWYDKDRLGYYPVFLLYSKEEMQRVGKEECKRRGIHQLLAPAHAYSAYNAEYAGICHVNTYVRSASTHAYYGFPLCLNSEEKAEFVVKQFFELCCACYGVTPKMAKHKHSRKRRPKIHELKSNIAW